MKSVSAWLEKGAINKVGFSMVKKSDHKSKFSGMAGKGQEMILFLKHLFYTKRTLKKSK
jgi:hypothetical protein